MEISDEQRLNSNLDNKNDEPKRRRKKKDAHQYHILKRCSTIKAM